MERLLLEWGKSGHPLLLRSLVHGSREIDCVTKDTVMLLAVVKWNSTKQARRRFALILKVLSQLRLCFCARKVIKNIIS